MFHWFSVQIIPTGDEIKSLGSEFGSPITNWEIKNAYIRGKYINKYLEMWKN